jgi:hypothetical protein
MAIYSSRFTGNQYWTDVIYQVPLSCRPPTVSLPFSEILSLGNISGCVLGNAQPISDGLVLTPPASDTYGAVTYFYDEFQPVLTASFTFIISDPSSGNGADGTFFYFNSNADALTEDDGSIEGYVVGFSEYHGLIEFHYGFDYIDFQPCEIDVDTLYTAQILFDSGSFTVSLNAEVVATSTDPNYNTRTQPGHNKFGLGARCGAQFAQHKVSNLFVANAV